MKKTFVYTIITIFFIIFIQLSSNAKTETLIILDQSASMYEPFKDRIKFYYAQEAVIKILNSLSKSEYIGFRTIGMNPDKLRARGIVDNFSLCTATEKLNDILPNNSENILLNLYGIIPSGTSPIEFVLNKAINEDFSDTADIKQIILITDGYENCHGNPCFYIKRLTKTRKDIKIHIISIGASDDDVENLKCLTNSTNGYFSNINSPYELNNSIANITSEINYYKTKIMTGTNPQKNYEKKIEYKNYLMEFKE